LPEESNISCEFNQELYIDIFDSTVPDSVGGCSGIYYADQHNEDWVLNEEYNHDF
jgi:hypothetical protein